MIGCGGGEMGRAPEEEGIVHAFWDEDTAILEVGAEFGEDVLLLDGEVAETAREGFVVWVSDAVWHGGCAGLSGLLWCGHGLREKESVGSG